MRYVQSKQFEKSKLIEDNSINSFGVDFGIDDEEDPLSVKRVSITLLGFTIAFMTILLPSLSIYLARPSSQENKVIINHSLKRDGS